MKKFENFCKALNNLKVIESTEEPYDILTLTGGIALFVICFEQAWKAMKEILTSHGYGESQSGSPKLILKLAYDAGMLQNEETWLAMLASRNEISHTYNEKVALSMMRAIKTNYIGTFEQLKTNLEERWLE